MFFQRDCVIHCRKCQEEVTNLLVAPNSGSPGAGFNGAQILRHLCYIYVWKCKPVISHKGSYDSCLRFGKSTTGVAESTYYWFSPQIPSPGKKFNRIPQAGHALLPLSTLFAIAGWLADWLARVRFLALEALSCKMASLGRDVYKIVKSESESVSSPPIFAN